MAPEQTVHTITAEAILMDLYRSGRLSEDLFRQRLIESIQAKRVKVLAREKRIIAATAAQGNYESLTTDTSGHRTQDWFEKTGQSFASGLASTCLALAIVDSHTGIWYGPL